jgi:predicted metal-dependent hydrolase
MKINELKISNEIVEYKIKNNSRSKKITLSITSDGDIVVTKPKYVSYKMAQNFVNSQIKWLNKNFDKLATNKMSQRKNKTQRDNEFKKLKKRALELVEERVLKINKVYGYKYNKISIRNQRTRWGSCSKKRTLSFNYKLIKLPLKYVDYVVTHELCHLKEFNHSKRYWDLVKRTIPDYKKIRKELKSFKL